MKHYTIAIKIAVILLLTICMTAEEGQSNNNIIESNRAGMLVPFSQVSKNDFVIDISQGNTEYMNGAISIPYPNFLKDNKLRSKEEISGILRDAGVPCDRVIYIYGKCLPCGGSSAPAEYIYLILKSFGYQVRLLDGSLEQWAASGGHTTGTPSVKPKTNCTPAVKTNGSGGDNQIRMAAGNGSRTDGGFAGNLTPLIINANGTVSEETTRTFKADLIGVIEENATIMPDGTVINNDDDRDRYLRKMNDMEIKKWEKIRDEAFLDFISRASGINFKIDLIDISEFRESMEKFQNNPRFIYTEHEARLELDPLYKFQYSLSRLQILYNSFKTDTKKPGSDTRALAAPTTTKQEIPKPLTQNDHPIPSIKPEE